jgi:acyl carrier protein
VKDLRIDSDNLSFILCPTLEDIAGCQIPFREWDNIYTIDNSIDWVKNHRDNHQRSDD